MIISEASHFSAMGRFVLIFKDTGIQNAHRSGNQVNHHLRLLLKYLVK